LKRIRVAFVRMKVEDPLESSPRGAFVADGRFGEAER